MSQEIDIRDLKRKRKAKKRKKLAKQIIAILIIIFIGAAVYYTKDRWLPFFDGIATRYLPKSENNGELAKGNFPLKISNYESCQIATLENSVAVIDDMNFFIYSADGENLADKQLNYSNPILETNNRKALIYDMGGTSFRLESKYKNLYTRKSDDTIILARLGHSENVAVVTKSDKFVSVMTVYNGSGEEIFKWKSVDSRIIDVTFTAADDGCIVTVFDANAGQLVSQLYRFSFDKTKEIWTSQNIDTMVISTRIRDDGTIVAFGDTKCAYYNKNGEYIGSYAYNSKLVDYSCSDTVTALIFKNEERRKSSLVLINDIKTDIKETVINEDVKHVITDGENAFLMTGSKIDEYSVNGTKKSTVSIGDEYNDFHKLGNYIFLLGYTNISRIDFVG